MNTKAIVSGFALVAASSITIAVLVLLFPGWHDLIERTPDIVIARCTKTPDPYNVVKNGIHFDMDGGVIESDIEVLFVLKGITNLGPALLRSQYWPRQSEQYLIFSTWRDGLYQAVEPYRIIPLGTYFPTNLIAGKHLGDQIQAVFRYRLERLNRELEKGQEEKKRLQEGLKK